MLKIERESDLPGATLRLIGRIRSQDLPDLESKMAIDRPTAVLDLAEVMLVDVDVVRFLGSIESHGIQLRHCPPFVREWICRENAEARQ
jgi:hypothetical protein